MDILICPVEKSAVCAQCSVVSPESTLVFVQESQSQLNWTALIAAPGLPKGRYCLSWGTCIRGTAMLLFLRCMYLITLDCKLEGSKIA